MMLKTLTFLSLLAFCVAKYKITTISEPKTGLGGAPHWDEERQSLYFVDIFAFKHNILRYDFKEKKIYRANIPNCMPLKVVDFIIPYKEDKADDKDTFIIGDRSRIAKKIRWDGKSEFAEIVNSSVFSVEQEFKYTLNFWHIASTDPTGRFYGGTLRAQFCNDLPTPNASLYKYTKNDGVQTLIDGGFKITGGMDWDRRNNKFYIVDICGNKILSYDWNQESGAISNRQVVFETHDGGNKAPHHPISVAVDREGMLFVSMFNGASIWKIDPVSSKLLEKIEMPTEIIVNMAFGGPNLDVLLVTSASVPLNLNTGLPNFFRKLSPEAGSLFIVELNGPQGYASSRWVGK